MNEFKATINRMKTSWVVVIFEVISSQQSAI